MVAEHESENGFCVFKEAPSVARIVEVCDPRVTLGEIRTRRAVRGEGGGGDESSKPVKRKAAETCKMLTKKLEAQSLQAFARIPPHIPDTLRGRVHCEDTV